MSRRPRNTPADANAAPANEATKADAPAPQVNTAAKSAPSLKRQIDGLVSDIDDVHETLKRTQDTADRAAHQTDLATLTALVGELGRRVSLLAERIESAA